MGKVLALDVGDVWTGIALSDELQLLARPYKMVKTGQLEKFLKDILAQEPITTVVVGYPRTLKGGESEQTRKTKKFKEEIEAKLDNVSWVLWDERLTSKRAQMLKKRYHKKYDEHSLAAAFILDSYLEHCRIFSEQ